MHLYQWFSLVQIYGVCRADDAVAAARVPHWCAQSGFSSAGISVIHMGCPSDVPYFTLIIMFKKI